MQKTNYINWREATKETGLEEVKTTFVDLFSKADYLPSIYHPVSYKYLKSSQIKHWDNDLFSFTTVKIPKIEKNRQ